MVYAKQTWADNPTGNTPLTAARLNNMEAGIASGTIVIPNTTIVGGGPPAGFSPIIQAGTFTATPNAGGDAYYTFGAQFPNGLISVVASSGDTASSFYELAITTTSQSGFNVNCKTNGGATISSIVRVNFVAVGW